VFGTLALAVDEACKCRVDPIGIVSEGDDDGIEDIVIIEYACPSSSLRGIVWQKDPAH
jgi:hypothetical protein